MFQVDKSYSKNDIYHILAVPILRQKGAWDTGYRIYDDNIYILQILEYQEEQEAIMRTSGMESFFIGKLKPILI